MMLVPNHIPLTTLGLHRLLVPLDTSYESSFKEERINDQNAEENR